MEVDLVELIEVELKYCERCGGLWVRPCGGEEVYCDSCRPLVAELPQVRVLVRELAEVVQSRDLEGRLDELFAVCEGGHA
jgi:hypothetical protein